MSTSRPMQKGLCLGSAKRQTRSGVPRGQAKPEDRLGQSRWEADSRGASVGLWKVFHAGEDSSDVLQGSVACHGLVRADEPTEQKDLCSGLAERKTRRGVPRSQAKTEDKLGQSR
eukprot:CAMPEP_0196654182 /NCGR_PEP_ID=MMETSP1086-20130531/3870_1 /TAXON_ID=77921 /ORGANISM="Cyanoptyche  gloeocystis , Strain SAG4.97" /LENGTH=114 /DNA_ID=CAMNT_0041985785 /DNA_START=370 /DNA_END=714 /DNA_ORIENTATION=+